ncbi:hypothetical protein [Pseudokineococcus sp. 1T1Z-3]|uniref:hypothetical protein n=1 Tax=Pseudokineococcus sp. 1T1Z-3 TaxID=3132745 RepID=UPI00309D9F26
MTAGEQAPARDVRRFRLSATPLPLSPAAALVSTLVMAAGLGVGAVLAALDGRGVVAALLGLAVLVLLAGGTATARGRSALATDVSAEGVHTLPDWRGRRHLRWDDVEAVEEAGRWRDEATLRTRDGKSRKLFGVPDDAVAQMAAVVDAADDGARQAALDELLKGDDVVPAPRPTSAAGEWLLVAATALLFLGRPVGRLLGLPGDAVVFGSVGLAVGLGVAGLVLVGRARRRPGGG